MRLVRRGRPPHAHLIHAGFSLPFCPPSRFPALWEQIRLALVPGAIFAGQLFGTRDSWAADPGMTFQDRSEVTRLLDGLEILELHGTERDGEAYSGPKHWHAYDILARQPAGHAHPGDQPTVGEDTPRGRSGRVSACPLPAEPKLAI